MFSQKKKKSKGLLFLIPVLLVFLAGLALNAFMSGENDDKTSEKDEDHLVSAGYDPDNNDSGQNARGSDEPDHLTSDNDDDKNYDSSSDVSEKGSKLRSRYEYTDNTGENRTSASGIYDGEVCDNTDEHDHASDPYSEMYEGYSGYRAVSEDNVLVIYKYSNGAVVSEERTDIQTDILPEYDREMLENGIDMSSESDVDELLQDYEG